MDARLNKPRAFLSHSKADSSFIERLEKDLRGCQIEPWLDTDEIRHGKPWLDAIFEEGIPTCDAVLVYFTESSLESAMVKKEMDAAILHQLKDRRVAFLPYVSSEAVRGRLRADIQALQTPVWDEGNYVTLLPKVVAEVWRSYLERTVASAVREEKVRRLEAELTLESLRKASSASVFSGAEEAEFTHIWNALDRLMAVKVEEEELGEKGQWRSVRTLSVSVVLNTLLPHLIQNRYEFDFFTVASALEEPLWSLLSVPADAKKTRFSIRAADAITDELVMYGLLERMVKPAQTSDSRFSRPSALFGPQYSTVWSDKSQRLRYWLSYHGRLSAVEFGDDVRDVPSSQDETTA